MLHRTYAMNRLVSYWKSAYRSWKADTWKRGDFRAAMTLWAMVIKLELREGVIQYGRNPVNRID